MHQVDFDDLGTLNSEFVGRGSELDRIATLLLRPRPARLVTLTGPGGIGKTRLAIEAARRGQNTRRMSVYWSRLARLTTGSSVAAVEKEIARSVVDVDLSGRPAWDVLLDTFVAGGAAGQKSHTVLILDNCEHVLGAAGYFIDELLAAVPELSVLATSREPIGWVDEDLVPVPPLTRQQALTLFQNRAELTGHSINGDDQISMVTKICFHMHNHPLFIRLAAARLRREPLAMILANVSGDVAHDKRLDWQHGPRVGAEARHRGVRDVIAGSYNLCSDKERLLFDRLSVFAEGYDVNPEDADNASAFGVGAELEAIEAVCTGGPPETGGMKSLQANDVATILAREEISDLLERLADRSLVTVHISSTTVRYSLLESLRLFARQRLQERSTDRVDEQDRLARLHRRYYRDKVVYAQMHWFGPAELDLLDRARAAWDNILIAVEGSLAVPGESVVGLEICTGLLALRLPFYGGSFRETRNWTEQTLTATRSLTPQPVELQIAAGALLTWMAILQGQPEDAEAMLEECAATTIADPRLRNRWRETAETDIGLPASVELAWGAELFFVRRDIGALTVLARAQEKFRHLGDGGGYAMSMLFAGLTAGLLGSSDQALEITARNMEYVTACGGPQMLCWARLASAIAMTKHGDPSEALGLQRTALARQLAIRDQTALWPVLFRSWTLAEIITDSIATGKADRATLASLANETAQLIGGVETTFAQAGIDINKFGPFTDEFDHAVSVARDILGSKAFDIAERQGRNLRPKLAEAQKLAMGTLSPTALAVPGTARVRQTSGWNELTPAESDVAVLAAAGWTNSAIAARRGKSVRTVDAQIAAIFRKLAITVRADIVKRVPRDRFVAIRAEAERRQHHGGSHSSMLGKNRVN